MAEFDAKSRSLIGGVILIALGGAAWLALSTGPDGAGRAVSDAEFTPSQSRADSSKPLADGAAWLDPDRPADYAIEENGRLTIAANALETRDTLTIDLAIPDVARGEEPIPARIIGVDGRAIDVIAAPKSEEDGGLQLSVDTEWLEPGKYMIQISTLEKTPLALRRYVLEVQ